MAWEGVRTYNLLIYPLQFGDKFVMKLRPLAML